MHPALPQWQQPFRTSAVARCASQTAHLQPFGRAPHSGLDIVNSPPRHQGPLCRLINLAMGEGWFRQRAARTPFPSGTREEREENVSERTSES
jgi:hypothetical protein